MDGMGWARDRCATRSTAAGDAWLVAGTTASFKGDSMADDEDMPIVYEQLAALWREGHEALAAAGLTADDFLAELPAAR
jgi:hypothetical protein